MYFESKFFSKIWKGKKPKLKRKYCPDFEVFQQSLSNKCLPLVETHFYENTRKGENNNKKIIKTHQLQILAEFSDTCRLLLYIIRDKTKNTSLKRVNIKSLK